MPTSCRPLPHSCACSAPPPHSGHVRSSASFSARCGPRPSQSRSRPLPRPSGLVPLLPCPPARVPRLHHGSSLRLLEPVSGVTDEGQWSAGRQSWVGCGAGCSGGPGYVTLDLSSCRERKGGCTWVLQIRWVTQALRSLRERRRAPSRRGGTARSSRRPGPAPPRRTTGLPTRYRPASPRAWPSVRQGGLLASASRCFTDARRL